MTDETVTPDQLAEEGKLAYYNKEYQESASLFQAALEAYQSAERPLDAAEMANNRSVALLHANHLEEALQAVEGVDSVFADAGDKRRQAMTLGNKASVLEKMKRYDEALTTYQQCADLFKEIGEHEMRAPVLKSISALQFQTGKQLESIASLDAGLNEQQQRSPVQSLLKQILSVPMRWLTRT
jgi:tetratricopeptide (TPR) repeat protein